MLETSPAMPIESTHKGAPAGLSALLGGVGMAALGQRAMIRVTGDDRVRWLNGMVSNSIQALQPGQGCYNFFLNAQGRIRGDATAFLLEDAILLETDRGQVAGLMAMLDRFIIMDDVELREVEERAGMLVAGPGAASLLAGLGLKAMPGPLTILRRGAVDVIHAESPLVPRFELWGDPAEIASLASALRDAGAEAAAEADLEALRLLEGTPLYGRDIRDKELPQETGQTRALHFAKGCYLGQEIVERIRSRGNVHRAFSGFVTTGSVPEEGAPLFAADAPEKAIGEWTSGGQIHLDSGVVTLGLGYVRRETLERGADLNFSGGTVVPVALPYRANGITA